MKKIRNLQSIGFLAILLLSGVTTKAGAQHLPDELHFNLDWQLNAPVGTDFAGKISGWGMNFESGYEITDHWSLGAFVNFHTNHQYVSRQTLPVSPTAALTTDQQQSSFQIPFGLLASYTLYDNGYIQPYVAGKVGAMYERNTSYLNTVSIYDEPWGFYVSPEIGVNIRPLKYGRFGFHVAAYYNYATNKTRLLTYDEAGRNNLGIRVGICF